MRKSSSSLQTLKGFPFSGSPLKRGEIDQCRLRAITAQFSAVRLGARLLRGKLTDDWDIEALSVEGLHNAENP